MSTASKSTPTRPTRRVLQFPGGSVIGSIGSSRRPHTRPARPNGSRSGSRREPPALRPNDVLQADRSVAHARVVLGQQVPGEVAAQVAPHGVDVIGPVLGVVVLDEQAWTAERVIVA